MTKDQLRVPQSIWKDKSIPKEAKYIYSYIYSKGYNRYFTDINVGEIQQTVRITNKGLILDNNPKVTLYGKGKKIRRIPITNNTKEIIIRYINEFKIGRFSYLFSNNKGEKYTTKMLEHVIKKYCKKADIRKNIHPHSFRHSKAMHLLEAGVNLIYIRDLLGHSSIKTTEIYARTNEELLRKKIREANDIKINKEIPKWHKDEQLLKSLLDL